MSCFLENDGKETIVLLQFEREQLLYDIGNICYIEGHVMPEEADVHQKHTVQDVIEAGNVDRVTRELDLRIAECRELLYPYTNHGIIRKELNDRLKARDVYAILMKVPEGFSQTTLTLLERLIHEYLVSRAVAEWLSISYPQKAETWRNKAEAADAALRRNLMARMGRTRRRMHPF